MSQEEFNRRTFKGALGALLFIVVLTFAVLLAATWAGVFTSVATAPARVVTKPLVPHAEDK